MIKRVLIIGLLVLSTALGTAAPQKKSKRANSHKSAIERKSSSKRTRTVVKSIKVQKGDNEWDIAKRNGMSVKELRKLNGGKSLAKIRPGQKLSVEQEVQLKERNRRSAAIKRASSVRTVSAPARSREIARGRVTGVNINVRNSPSSNAAVVTKVTGGEVAILATSGEWMKLRFQYGSEGWVKNSFVDVYGNKLAKKASTPKVVKPSKPTEPIVAKNDPAPKSEIESDPASGGAAVISLTNADLEENKPVTSSKKTEEKQYATLTGDSVNVRRGPSTSNSVVTKVKSGKAEIVDKWGDWYKLKFTYGTTGWVRADYLDIPGVSKPKSFEREVTVASAPSGDKVDKVLRSANSMRGTRYVYGAASRGATDCSGFTLQVFRSNGINLPRTAREQVKCGQRVSRGDLQAGDLVFFNTRGYVSHVGIYIGGNRFIHASSGGRRVMESPLSGYYSSRYITARRVIKGGTKLILPKGGTDLSLLEPSQQAAPGTDAIGE